jgi:uncharacterized protein (DUF952 family)
MKKQKVFGIETKENEYAETSGNKTKGYIHLSTSSSGRFVKKRPHSPCNI